MKRDRRPVYLVPGPARDELLNTLATVSDRILARAAAAKKQEEAIRPRAVSSG